MRKKTFSISVSIKKGDQTKFVSIFGLQTPESRTRVMINDPKTTCPLVSRGESGERRRTRKVVKFQQLISTLN
jgi:hypothetical protein